MKDLKSNTDANNSTRIRYVSKLIRIKYSKKGSRLRTEMTNDDKTEKDFWKFCKEVFESENQVLPDFDEQTCSDYFIKSLKKRFHLRDFNPSSWMKSLDEPDSPFDTTPPSYRKISKIIHKMKSSGSACPFNHINVIALKRCPILRSALHRIIVYCWTKKVIPATFRKGFCLPIYKKGTPKEPSNFRPITLEPVCAKVFTSLIRNRMYSSLVNNSYIETNIQKGFWTGISGTIEHTETLTYMINHARRYQRNLVITLLDLKNAFDELDHNLITSVLHYHHVPDHIRSLIGSFYTN